MCLQLNGIKLLYDGDGFLIAPNGRCIPVFYSGHEYVTKCVCSVIYNDNGEFDKLWKKTKPVHENSFPSSFLRQRDWCFYSGWFVTYSSVPLFLSDRITEAQYHLLLGVFMHHRPECRNAYDTSYGKDLAMRIADRYDNSDMKRLEERMDKLNAEIREFGACWEHYVPEYYGSL